MFESAAAATVAAQLLDGVLPRALAVLVGAAVGSAVAWRGWRRVGRWAVVTVLAVAGAVATTRVPRPPAGASHVGRHGSSAGGVEDVIVARVDAIVPREPGGARFLLSAWSFGGGSAAAPLAGKLYLYVRTEAPALRTGDCVRFRARLREIRNFGNFGELDWAGWNARRGIFTTAFLWSGESLVRSEDGCGPPGLVAPLRAEIGAVAKRGGGRGGALLAALVTGDRSAMSESDTDSMRAAGLAHVLAISGLHLGLVGGAVLWASRRVLVRTPWARGGFDVARPAAIAALAAVLAYATLSGGGISVARATVMALLAAVAIWNGRPGGGLRALGLASVGVSLALPGVAREAGFQLSFAAVGAILVYAHLADPVSGRLAAARAATELSFLCWMVTTPIVAEHFGAVQVYGAIATIVTAPLVTAVVGAGLLAAMGVVLGLPGAFVDPVAGAARLAAELLLSVAHAIAALPGARFDVVAPGPFLTTLLATLPLVAWHVHRRPGGRRVLRVVTLATVALVLVAWWQRHRADVLDLYVLSVGQGDAAVLKLPGGKVAVIDAGPRGRGERVLAPFLRWLHVAHVDYFVVTHAQEDHGGGAAELARSVTIGELWTAAGDCDVEWFEELRRVAAAAGAVDVRVGDAGETLPSRRASSARLAALWPRAAAGDCDDNDRSVVVRAEFAGRALLLAGDLEANGEAALVAAGGPALVADVVAAPHHGSRTSSTAAFVDAVGPQIVVASAGVGNRYGFPRPETVARYRAAGARVLSTAEEGAVHVRIGRGGAIGLRTTSR